MLLLDQWSIRVMDLKVWFSCLSFTHLYHEFNSVADSLSKMDLWEMDGLIHFEEWLEEELIESRSIDFF